MLLCIFCIKQPSPLWDALKWDLGSGAVMARSSSSQPAMPCQIAPMVLSKPSQTSSVRLGFRSSQRITITLPYAIAHGLMQRSIHEGRSLSNLAAFLLEASLQPTSPCLSTGYLGASAKSQ